MKTLLYLITFTVLGLVSYPNLTSAQLTCSSYSMDFDGTDDAIEFNGITTNDEMTVEFWFYPGSTETEAILSSLDDENYYGFRIYHEVNQDGPFWYIGFQSDEGFTVGTGFEDVGQQWYHIAIIFTPTETRYLRNGDDGDGWFLHDISLLETFPTTLHFGAGVGVAHFSGMLDEFRIWSRALTGDEIRSNMYTRFPGGADGLVTYFPFNEGSGSTTDNIASSGNNGTLQNGPTWVEIDYTFNDCVECTNPNVSGQPIDEIVFVGNDATFSASSTDADSPTLQWQVSTNEGEDWSDISGETSGTLSVEDVTMSMNAYRYRAAFTNDCGTSLSDEACSLSRSKSQILVLLISV